MNIKLIRFLTSVHLAALEGHIDTTRFLISVTPNWLTLLEARTVTGASALQLAERFQKHAVVAFLRRIYFCRKLAVIDDMSVGYPGHAAASHGDLNHLKDLVESGAMKVDCEDDKGNTMLHKGLPVR